jgi:hypothetical protein
MKWWLRMVVAAVIAVMLTLVFSWPLGRYADKGVAASATRAEQDAARVMVPGDHLQFLYHMWLGKDTLAGPTPLFYNLYEFNTGDDAARREVRPYYLPFSLFFVLGSLSGNQALGWNGAIALTMWLTFLFTWLLARRYCRDEWLSAWLATLPLILPFTWIVLLGGSPTGFAMMWVPILLYGIDRWIAERSVLGAALVGAVILFSEWSDTHVFFFSVLLTPAWLLVTYAYRIGWRWPHRDEWRGWLRAAWPLYLLVAAALFKAWSVHQGLQDTAIASGRSLHEILLYSHGMRSLVNLPPQGDGSKIYLGYYGLLLIAAAGLSGLWLTLRRPNDLRRWSIVLLGVGIVGVLILAMGPRSPLGAKFWQVWTTVIPPYGMIRQPDKIFALLPALLTVLGAMLMGVSGPAGWARKARLGLPVLLLPLMWDYQQRLSPAICVLDAEQAAYAAVAEDSAEANIPPRALALPLWPGDSHWSSLYQYYASLYRIRMVNGYRPTARQPYIESIFEPYNSMNAGYPSDQQLDGLLAMGVQHLLFHEDAFPEKVGSFPAGVSLANLLDHPRLRLRARDESVWCFTIDVAAEEGAARSYTDSMEALFPVRRWDWSASAWPAEFQRKADDAIGGRYVTVQGPMSSYMDSRYIRTAGPFPFAWHLRVRGAGSFELMVEADGNQVLRDGVDVASRDWLWIQVPAMAVAEPAEQTARIRVTEGVLDLDEMILTHAAWQPLAVGDERFIPATSFFRAGYTTNDFQAVALRADRDRADVILYGHSLYLEAGEYDVEFRYAAAADNPVSLGTLSLSYGGRDAAPAKVEVLAGQAARLRYLHPDNQFFAVRFAYSRKADMLIEGIAFQRVR